MLSRKIKLLKPLSLLECFKFSQKNYIYFISIYFDIFKLEGETMDYHSPEKKSTLLQKFFFH